MRLKLLITFLFYLNCITQVNSQWLKLNFDDQKEYNLIIEKDTIRNHKSWQIGKPSKINFKTENNHKNVLITDTIKACEKNDTFSSIIKYIREFNKFTPKKFIVKFDYQLQGLESDKGFVEVSTNQGKNWVNLITDSNTYNIQFLGNTNFSGTSQNWEVIQISLSTWNGASIGYPNFLYGMDTLLFRFTYCTDSTNISRDGWMIDNFEIQYGLSIYRLENYSNYFTIYPQPSSDIIYFSNKKEWTIDGVEIYNTLGQKMLYDYSENITSINTENLPNGLYSIRIKSHEQWYEQKVVVER